MSFPEIIYEDNHLIVVNKPAGLLTQGDRSGRPSLLDRIKDFIKERDQKPGNVFLGMVQRLDQPVSGLIIFAKTSKAAGRLSAEIRERRIVKIYLGITSSDGRKDYENDWREIRHHLVRRGHVTVGAGAGEQDAKLAILKVRTIFRGRDKAVHLIRLVTGRKHQIRAQFSLLGLPLLGDRRYGSSVDFPGKGIALHAYQEKVKHPVKGEEMTFSHPPPAEFSSLFSPQERSAIAEKLARATQDHVA